MIIPPVSNTNLPPPEPSRGKVAVEKVKAENEVRSEVKPAELAKELKLVSQKLGSEVSFSVDHTLNRVVVTITDRETNQVIRQIPPQELLDLAVRLKEITENGDVRGLLIEMRG